MLAWRCGLVCWLLILAPLGTVARSDDGETLSIYFTELRASGLFQVAEEYALARLSEGDLSPADQALVAVELSRCMAAHAAEAPSPAEALELWARAEEALRPCLADPDHPRWILCRTRQATLLSDRARAEYWKSQLHPDSVRQRADALEATQRALAGLLSAQAELRVWLQQPVRGAAGTGRPASPNARRGPGDLSSIETRRMGDELEFLAIRVRLDLSQQLPEGPVRVATLLDADTSTAAFVKRSASDYFWPARVARIEVTRHLGQPDQAVTLAKSYIAGSVPPRYLDAVIAEQARAELARNRTADALQLLVDHGRSQGTLSSELRAVNVECLLASLVQVRAKAETALPRPEELASVEAGLWEQIELQRQRIDGPWRTYVDGLVTRARQSQEYGDELAVLVRSGQRAIEAQEWSAAAAAYEQAADQSEREGKAHLAAEFAYTRGSIAIQAGEMVQAGKLLSAFQTRFPSDERGADAQLLVAWAAGQRHEQQPSPALRTEYQQQLHTLIERYPDRPARVEAEWALAVDAIQHAEWSAAIPYLEAIPADHPRVGEVVAQWPYCYERLLSLREENADREAWEQRASAALQQQLGRWPRPPLGWSVTQSESALRWTRALLHSQSPRFQDADALLRQVTHSRDLAVREAERDGAPPLAPGWAALMPAVHQLRIVTLAGLGRLGEAETLLRQVTTEDPRELLQILSGLAELSGSLEPQSHHDLGRVQLAIARRLDRQRAGLNAEEASTLDRCLAEAFTATGDLPEAIAIYERVRQSRPRDRALLETVVQLSLQRGQAEDLQRAKTIQQQLEGLDPAGSPAWLRNRLELARICLKLGATNESRKLLKVTRILYPALGGAELKAKYEALEQELPAP